MPALIKCAKEAAPDNIDTIHTMAKAYSNNIIEAMDDNTNDDAEREGLDNLNTKYSQIVELIGRKTQNKLVRANLRKKRKNAMDIGAVEERDDDVDKADK